MTVPSSFATQIFDRFAPGTMLGRYELLATIGEGGMARVILARQRCFAGFEKVVVIKVVLPQMAGDDEIVGMLLDEARIAAQINHPNVVQTFELGEAHGTFYIVMEYLAGETLERMLHVAALGPSLDPRIAARIVADAAGGLHAAHELQSHDGRNLGVIHRDVSPGNLVVLYTGGVKVLDFGIVKTHDRITTTHEGQLKGKYGYMSPEQIRNEPMDRRSDVFSLGVVLWESLTLQRLFAGNAATAVIQILQDERVPPSRLRPEIPAALDAITLKALAHDPRDRFESALELKRALESTLWSSRCDTSDVEMYMTAVFGDRIAKRKKLLASVAITPVRELTIRPFDEDSGIGLASPEVMLLTPPKPTASHDRTNKLRKLAITGGFLATLGLGIALRLHAETTAARAAPPAPIVVVKPQVPNPPVVTAIPRPATVPAPVPAPPPAPPNDQAVAPPPIKSLLRPEHLEPTRVEPAPPPVRSDVRPPPAPPIASAKPSPQLLYVHGRELFLAGKFAEAATTFQQAIAANAGYAPAHRGLGFVYQRTGDSAKARTELRRYLALDPHASDADAIRDRIDQLSDGAPMKGQP